MLIQHIVIQLARLSGFSPIIVTASLSNEEYLKGLGATHVINYKKTPDWEKEVLSIVRLLPLSTLLGPC